MQEADDGYQNGLASDLTVPSTVPQTVGSQQIPVELFSENKDRHQDGYQTHGNKMLNKN